MSNEEKTIAPASLLKNAAGPIKYGLTNDYMFRAVFQNSEEALRHLLSALLEIAFEEIVSCEIKNPIILGETIDEKTCILDIRLLLNRNRLINIEMQTSHLEHWDNRALFYLSRLYCSIRQGEDYGQLLPAMHIGILSKSPFENNNEFFSEYLIRNAKTGHVFSRNFSIRMLNLSQMENVPEEEKDSELYYWAKLFKATTWEEIRMLSEEKDYLNAAATNLCELSEEEKIQLQCEARDRYYLEMSCAQEAGYTKGKNVINQLNERLIQAGRIEDLKRSVSDEVFQTQLLQEYGLLE